MLEIAEAIARQLATVDNAGVRDLIQGIQIGTSASSLPVFVLERHRSQLLQERERSRLVFSAEPVEQSVSSNTYESAHQLAMQGKTAEAIVLLERLCRGTA